MCRLSILLGPLASVSLLLFAWSAIGRSEKVEVPKADLEFVETVLSDLNNVEDCKLPTVQQIGEVNRIFAALQMEQGDDFESNLSDDQKLMKKTLLRDWESFVANVDLPVMILSARKRMFINRVEDYQMEKFGSSVCTRTKRTLGPKTDGIFKKNPIVRYLAHLETGEIIDPPPEAQLAAEAKARAELIAKARAEEEAKLRAEEEAKLRAEEEEKLRAEEEAKLKAEEEAKLRAEEEARVKAEAEERAKAKEAEDRAEAEARAKREREEAEAEAETRKKLEVEAKAKADEEAARIRAQAEALAREAAVKIESEARDRLEAEAREKAETEARVRAEETAKLEKIKAEAEARARAESERVRLEAEARAAEERARVEAEAREAKERARVEAEEKARVEAETRAAEEKARVEAEEKARVRAEETAKLEKIKAEAEARAKAESERLRLEAEARAAEERARVEAAARAAEELARKKAVDETNEETEMNDVKHYYISEFTPESDGQTPRDISTTVEHGEVDENDDERDPLVEIPVPRFHEENKGVDKSERLTNKRGDESVCVQDGVKCYDSDRDNADLDKLVEVPELDMHFDTIYGYFKWPDECQKTSSHGRDSCSVKLTEDSFELGGAWAKFMNDPYLFDEELRKANGRNAARTKADRERLIQERIDSDRASKLFAHDVINKPPPIVWPAGVSIDRWRDIADNKYCRMSFNQGRIVYSTKSGYKAVKGFTKSALVSSRRRLLSLTK